MAVSARTPTHEAEQVSAEQHLVAVTRPASLTPVDYFRGLAIVEVVLHHASGAARDYAPEGSGALLALSIINRVLHFAVPAFLFLSAAVLTRSLLREPDFGRYFSRRVVRGAWPYLLWTLLYVIWSAALGDRPWSELFSAEKWQLWLAYGKGNYHLYFLLVALEAYLLLPFLLPLARARVRISAALGLGLAVQVGIYWANKIWWQLSFPASTVLWYLAPVIVGVAVGGRWSEFQEWWARRRGRVLALTGVALALHLPLALAFLDGAQVSPWWYSASNWLFTTLMALVLLGAGYGLWQRNRMRLVGVLGGVSLQIYLIHPALLEGLKRLLPPGESSVGASLMFALMVALSLVVPFVVARLLIRRGWSALLFGR